MGETAPLPIETQDTTARVDRIDESQVSEKRCQVPGFSHGISPLFGHIGITAGGGMDTGGFEGWQGKRYK